MSPEEKARLARSVGKAPAAPTPTLTSSRPGRAASAGVSTTRVEMDVETAEDKLRKELFAKFQAEMGPATKEAVLARVDEEMASRTQPAFVGGFVSPVVPFAEGRPSKLPEEEPMPVGRGLTFGEVIRPKVRVAKASKEAPFDDLKFEQSLKGVTPDEARRRRASYAGFKSAYARIRALNPETSTEDIVADIQRQLGELPAVLQGEGAAIAQDPRYALGIASDPFAMALSRQTKVGTVPKLEPGQLAFMKGIYEAELPMQVAADRETLKKEGKALTRKEKRTTGEVVGGRPVVEEVDVPTGQVVPYTPQEIDTIVSRRQSEGKYDARPWWANEAERQRVLADPEKYAKGGLLFEKKYATGATVESPVAWTVRAAMSPINAAAGFVGYGFTPEDIQRQKSEGRPEKYKGTGVAENILYNVAQGGGFTQEIGDLYKYHPDPTVRRYETLGKAAGFAADILSLGDLAVAAGATGGVEAGVQAARAARLVGEAAPVAAGLRAGARGAVSSYLDAIPGLGKLAERLQPGDVRLIYGGKLADDFKAASAYKAAYDESYNATLRGTDVADEAAKSSAASYAHMDALNAVERQYGNTKFYDDALNSGMDIRKSIDKDYFTEAQRAFKEADDVSRLADDLALGRRTLTTAEELRLKPYLAAAAKSDPDIALAIRTAFQGAAPGTRVTVGSVFDALSRVAGANAATAANIYADAIKSTAAFEAGVKTLDTQLASVYSKGAPTVMLTPRTLTSAKAADEIAEAYRATDFYREAVTPLQELPRVNVDTTGKVTRGFNLSDLGDPAGVTARLRQAVNEARLSGGLAEQDAARIMAGIDRGALAADDLRVLVYAEVDDLALRGGTGFTQRAVAERIGRKFPREVEQARRVQEITGELSTSRRLMNDAIAKALPQSIRDTVTRFVGGNPALDKLVSPVQQKIIASARGRVSALDKTLRDEFQRIGSDPEFAGMYGVTTDAPIDEKLIALGRGVVVGGDPAVGRAYAESLLDSIFYGTEHGPIENAFLGAYDYGRAVMTDTAEYGRMVDDIASLTPRQLASRLDSIFDDAATMVERNINPAITDAGGRVLSVPASLGKETLAVAYARSRTGEIIADAAVRVIPERPIGVSEPARRAIAALNAAGTGVEGDKFFYALLKDYINRPTDLDDLILEVGAGEFGNLRGYLLDVVTRTNPGLDPARASRFATDWMLAADPRTGRMNVYEIMGDLQDQVDLMRAGGLVADGNVDMAIRRIDDLMAGRIQPNQLVVPALAEKMLADIGTEPKYKAMLKELSRLSDLAHDGNVSAARAAKTLRWALDSYTAFFYYNTLSLSPRFHGVNNLTAPLITYFTTGRPSNFLRTGEAANVLMLGSPLVKNPVARMSPVVTDRFGNVYTRGDLYDLAIKGGLFKSQINTEVAGSFIEDANATIGNLSRFQKGKRVFTAPREFLGDPLAVFTDNVWRMETVTAALRDGKTVDEALDLGRRSLYDYGNLTDAERLVSRNFFVFYNYFRQSIVQFVKNAVDNPSRIIRMVRATEQPSKILVGDQNARDLSFYFPQEFGVARIVLDVEPGLAKKEGRSVALPMMPHADALNIAGMALTDPVALIGGPTPEGGYRAFAEGALAKRLGPLTKAGAALVASDIPMSDLLEVKLTKNRIPPEHAAIYEMLPAPVTESLFRLFGVTRQDAAPGEESSLYGKSYHTTDDGFAMYVAFLNGLQATGMSRTLTDYGKMIGGMDLSGPYARTPGEYAASALGAATYGGATAEDIKRRRAMEARASVLSKEAATMERERLPKKERD